MDFDFPTSGDYAYAAAQDAKRDASNNSNALKELEERVEYLETILRAKGLIPKLQLDPLAWSWMGERFNLEDRPELKYVAAFKPRKGYEQKAEKYGYRQQ